MGTKVSKTAIGAFVLGAIVLLVGGVLVLGAGKIFTREHTFITYFEGSVKGLSPGSPVTFRGVKVGSVTNISIIADPTSRSLKIPVIFTLEPAKFKGTKAEFQRDPKAVETAVTSFGLRTQLQMMSFVTGQLMVSLEFYPNTTPKFVGLNTEYPEIPSVPTPLEELQKTLERLPFKEIVNDLNTTIVEVQRLVSSINAKKTAQTLEETMREFQALARRVNTRVGPLMESLTKTSRSAEATLGETTQTMAAARENMEDLKTTMNETLETAEATLRQSEKTLKNFSGDSRVMVEMNRTLGELTKATRSLRHLSDYLERHPESLLRGKDEDKGD